MDSDTAFGVVFYGVIGGALLGALYLLVRFLHWAWVTPLPSLQ